jgi:hypothetical protein
MTASAIIAKKNAKAAGDANSNVDTEAAKQSIADTDNAAEESAAYTSDNLESYIQISIKANNALHALE